MKLTQKELVDMARERFGNDPLDWAFECPICHDIATGRDFKAALADNPRKHRSGDPVIASDILGQECIGRTLGALREKAQSLWKGRGCDWAAYGFFPGPWEIQLEIGTIMRAFPLAPAPRPAVAEPRPLPDCPRCGHPHGEHWPDDERGQPGCHIDGCLCPHLPHEVEVYACAH